jgi:hypothetical protein
MGRKNPGNVQKMWPDLAGGEGEEVFLRNETQTVPRWLCPAYHVGPAV